MVANLSSQSGGVPSAAAKPAHPDPVIIATVPDEARVLINGDVTEAVAIARERRRQIAAATPLAHTEIVAAVHEEDIIQQLFDRDGIPRLHRRRHHACEDHDQQQDFVQKTSEIAPC
jgi:hypothetical protein